MISYQWYRNAVAIAGAESDTYTTPAVTLADDGVEFSVVVSNAYGSVTSRSALLTVSSPSGWARLGGALNTVTPVRYPSIAVHDNGTIYVAYAVGSSGVAGLEGTLRVSTWDGTQWGQVGQALNDPAPLPNGNHEVAPEWPYIQVGSDGAPVVAWVSRTTTVSEVNKIIVQRWDGAAWQRIGGTPSGVSAGATGASAPVLVLGAGSNQPFVAFSEGICNVFREWDGNAWGPDAQRACAASNQSSLALAVPSATNTALVAGSPVPPPPQDSNGNFTELRNWISVRYRGAQDSGFFSSQLGDGPVNPTIADQFLAAGLAISDTDGRQYIAYVSRDSVGAVSMAVRWRSAATWNALGGNLLGADPFVSSVPHLRIEARSGVPVTAWLSGSSAESRITGRAWIGQAWQTVSPPHDATVNIGHFGFTVAANGKLYMAYTESAGQPNPQQGTSLYVSTCDNWCQ